MMVTLIPPAVKAINLPHFISELLAYVDQGQARIELVIATHFWAVDAGYILKLLEEYGLQPTRPKTGEIQIAHEGRIAILELTIKST